MVIRLAEVWENDVLVGTEPYEVPDEVVAWEQIVLAAETALGTNRTYLAVPVPTNAQVAAQVRALTQQNVKIIRLLLNKLDGTD